MKVSRGRTALLLSVTLLFSVFGYAFWASRPRVETWTATVFDTATYGDTIHVFSYRDGARVFRGTYNFTSGQTYRITYLTGSSFPKLLAVEEVPS